MQKKILMVTQKMSFCCNIVNIHLICFSFALVLSIAKLPIGAHYAVISVLETRIYVMTCSTFWA